MHIIYIFMEGDILYIEYIEFKYLYHHTMYYASENI